MLGEPLLRMWMRRPLKRVTVPALLAEETRLDDSLAIARWADDQGSEPTLFPRHHQPRIAELNGLSEQILKAARGRITPRIRASAEARMEAVPPPLRRLGKVASALAAQGATFIMKKYDTEATSAERHLESMRLGLLQMQQVLAGRDYAFDGLTFADIALAVALQPVVPVSDAFLRLGSATRIAWTESSLAPEFPDLIAWRDELYARHRRS